MNYFPYYLYIHFHNIYYVLLENEGKITFLPPDQNYFQTNCMFFRKFIVEI